MKKCKLKNISNGSASQLNQQQSEKLIAHLEQYAYLNAYQITAYVREKDSITYSHYGMVVGLHRHDFFYKESGRRRTKSDAKKQEDYTRLKDYLPEYAVVLLGDGLHPSLKTEVSSSYSVQT